MLSSLQGAPFTCSRTTREAGNHFKHQLVHLCSSFALPSPPHSSWQERLEREYDLDLITTAPTVVYRCITTDGQEIVVDCPSKLPDASKRESISEPYVR